MAKYDCLVYAATPSRLTSYVDDIMQFVTDQGFACLHPFKALPYEYYEGGKVGRDKTLVHCCRLVEVCDEFWVFGISKGVLTELRHVFQFNKNSENPMQVRLMLELYDLDWRDIALELRHDFKDEFSLIDALSFQA